MDGGRLQGRPVYARPPSDSYYHLYGTVRGNPLGKPRGSLEEDSSTGSRTKKQFNFLPWKKNKSKTDDLLQPGVGPSNLGKHNKYKFGSVSALSSGNLYRDFDSTLSYTPSYSASDLKHASVRSAAVKSRGVVAYPWETYNNNNISSSASKNRDNNKLNNSYNNTLNNKAKVQPVSVPEKTKNVIANVAEDKLNYKPTPCQCQKKKSGPFGTLNLRSLKSSKCNCGFSSVRSSRGFAPPPPPRRKSILPEKVDLYAVHEDQVHQDPLPDNRPSTGLRQNIYDTLSRHGKYRAPVPPVQQFQPKVQKSQPAGGAAQAKFIRSLEKTGNKDPFSSVSSRKSILECDVTAYDLVKNYLKSSLNDADSDIDDDLSDNVIEAGNGSKNKSLVKAKGQLETPKFISANDDNLKNRTVVDKSPSPVSSESESGIYSQPSSIRIGGHGMKVFSSSDNSGGSQTPSLYSEGSKTNSVDSRTSSWSNSSISDDGIYSLPEPDYDVDKVNDLDKILPYGSRLQSNYTASPSSMRKYASGDCLLGTDSSQTFLGNHRQYPNESPQFSTVRRACSMVTLAPRSGLEKPASGTSGMGGRIPSIPEPPQITQQVPPPPPPPPPPPSFAASNAKPWNTSVGVSSADSENVEDIRTANRPFQANQRKPAQNDMSSSIAAELTEKLKGNKPLLKKKQFEIKAPPKINATNPYMEVKSILKKTSERNLTNLNRGEMNPVNSEKVTALQEFQDIKKKKRVQFKSLSDESLAVEHIQHLSLSSSDEEWEEARESLDSVERTPSLENNKKASTNTSTEFDLKQVHTPTSKEEEGFQTVEEFLTTPIKSGVTSNYVPRLQSGANTEKLNTRIEHNLPKGEYKVPVKAPLLTRPSQPPPPPPLRKTSALSCPPSRPLSHTPKSFSVCDLRPTPQKPMEKDISRSQNLGRSTARVGSRPQYMTTGNALLNRGKPRAIAPPSYLPPNGSQLKQETTATCPKNGVPSPAASLEATTSARGKTDVHTGDQQGSTGEDTCMKTYCYEALADDTESSADLDAVPFPTEDATLPEVYVPLPNVRTEIPTIQNDDLASVINRTMKNTGQSYDDRIGRSAIVTTEDTDEFVGSDISSSYASFEEESSDTNTSTSKEIYQDCDDLYDNTELIDCQHDESIGNQSVNGDIALEDSSKSLTQDHDINSKLRRQSDLHPLSKIPRAIICRTSPPLIERVACVNENNINNTTDNTGQSIILAIHNGEVESRCNIYQQNDEKDDLNSEIEGPLYSNLLYVPCRNSPSPPPLPLTPPPRRALPQLPQMETTIPFTPNSEIQTSVEATYDQPSYITRWNLMGCPSSVPNENPYERVPQKSKTCSEKDHHGIYESRRYSDTGVTVVTISTGYNGYDDSQEVQDPDSMDHIYASLSSESIYEELPSFIKTASIDLNPFGRYRRSFFEGASKAEILNYLEGAKNRVVNHIVEEEILMLDDEQDEIPQSKAHYNVRNNPIRISNISSSSESSTLSSNSSSSRNGNSSDDVTSIKCGRPTGPAEIERADSGVGTETSKPHRHRRSERQVDEELLCADCDQQVEGPEEDVAEPSELICCPLVCKKCDKKRSERKEIVTEIVETEFKYGKDLRIIKEEFYAPMEVAALLSKDQLKGVFLNLEELMLVSGQFAETLKDALDIAMEQGDEDYTTVNLGKLFLETSTMLQAFEVYCIQQGSASVLLSNLEKEKELLGIFLRVSQMENTLLRRMNLSAFLMVPVQRVTKYPLLLNRLYKVTPYHHKDREALREAQLKIELHLEHINQQTKGVTGTKIWRRISNISASHRRIVNVSDIGSIQFRKMAMEILQWSKEEIRFVMAGKLAFSVSADFTRSRRGKAVKFTPSHALLATLGKPNGYYRPDLVQDTSILFPRNTGIRDATLLLMREKNGRYSLAREPLHLGSCIISSELEDEDIIEIQEYTTKESLFLKAECRTDALDWLKQLRYHAKDLGNWRRRRNALANIMINGMVRQ